MPQKTFIPDVLSVQKGRRWHVLDAQGQVVGRLAGRVASLLKGKHKTIFTPHIDCGDFVIVTHAEKAMWTGKKLEQKTYFRHSGYAKGAKIIPLKREMARDPRKVMYLAVKRMLHANRFRDPQLSRLKIYIGGSHPHAAQLAATQRPLDAALPRDSARSAATQRPLDAALPRDSARSAASQQPLDAGRSPTDFGSGISSPYGSVTLPRDSARSAHAGPPASPEKAA